MRAVERPQLVDVIWVWQKTRVEYEVRIEPLGTAMAPLHSLAQPTVSPTRLSGPTASAMNRPLSSITPNTVPGSACR